MGLGSQGERERERERGGELTEESEHTLRQLHNCMPLQVRARFSICQFLC
ncbi:hypothetical protein Sjap_010902 [Stephania japonica]|uniref:Uncharacterized protein n=1 Tax=Stephania japonica TaxID=461633 RepID=A0AAP0JBB8_9MAGN